MSSQVLSLSSPKGRVVILNRSGAEVKNLMVCIAERMENKNEILRHSVPQNDSPPNFT